MDNKFYLKEKRCEYIAKLEDITTNLFLQGIISVYKAVKDKCKNNRNILKEFQLSLRDIKEWTRSDLKKEYARFVSESKCKFIDKLITSIFKIYYLTNGIKENDYPSVSQYIHECYLNIARRVFKNPYLVYDIGVNSFEISKNNRDIEKIIRRCINDTFVQMLPFSKLDDDDEDGEDGEDDEDGEDGVDDEDDEDGVSQDRSHNESSNFVIDDNKDCENVVEEEGEGENDVEEEGEGENDVEEEGKSENDVEEEGKSENDDDKSDGESHKDLKPLEKDGFIESYNHNTTPHSIINLINESNNINHTLVSSENEFEDDVKDDVQDDVKDECDEVDANSNVNEDYEVESDDKAAEKDEYEDEEYRNENKPNSKYRHNYQNSLLNKYYDKKEKGHNDDVNTIVSDVKTEKESITKTTKSITLQSKNESVKTSDKNTVFDTTQSSQIDNKTETNIKVVDINIPNKGNKSFLDTKKVVKEKLLTNTKKEKETSFF